jgi:hypothetical protein
MSSSSIFTVFLAALILSGMATLGGARRARAGEVSLDAKALYAGFRAQRIIPDEEGGKLALDPHALKAGKAAKGVLITDVIDLAGSAKPVAPAATAKSVEVELKASAPDGTTVTVELRSGASFFKQDNWSTWSKLAGLKGKVDGLKGRYVQLKISLATKDGAKSPEVTGLTLKPDLAVSGSVAGIKITEQKLETIVRSPVTFHYERPDHEKLVKFRKMAMLDDVISGKLKKNYAGTAFRSKKQIDLDAEIVKASGAGEDFMQLVRLMDWTGACFNDRNKAMRSKTYTKPGYYDWNIENVWHLVDAEVTIDGKTVKVKRPTIYGHCMSYSEVLTIAATAMGFKARHLSVVGVRQRSHEVCEIWVPSLGKWVYFDPSLSNYYYDKKTKMPMCMIEMHKVIIDNFIPEGKNVNWFRSRGGKYGNEVKKYVAKQGGSKKVIGSRLGQWKYGAPMPANYEWWWRHGYMVSGFVQMTARNDFHANPKKHPRRFGSYPGYAGYPLWSDKKTPFVRRSNPVTRMRDFYWTLDQAGVKLTAKAGGELAVELGNSMPFFKKYEAKVDGKSVDATGKIIWKLKKGKNQLEVTPVDEFGKRGVTSSITLEFGG